MPEIMTSMITLIRKEPRKSRDMKNVKQFVQSYIERLKFPIKVAKSIDPDNDKPNI